MKLDEMAVHTDNYNFTNFHQNQMKNKNVLLIVHFSVQNFKVLVELWKWYIVHVSHLIFSLLYSDTKEQMVLFTKLFFIMGITWISECIHIELHGDHTTMVQCNFYFEVFLRILGGLNMIRGFFIFLVFICKPKILG